MKIQNALYKTQAKISGSQLEYRLRDDEKLLSSATHQNNNSDNDDNNNHSS